MFFFCSYSVEYIWTPGGQTGEILNLYFRRFGEKPHQTAFRTKIHSLIKVRYRMQQFRVRDEQICSQSCLNIVGRKNPIFCSHFNKIFIGFPFYYFLVTLAIFGPFTINWTLTRDSFPWNKKYNLRLQLKRFYLRVSKSFSFKIWKFYSTRLPAL